MIIHRSALALLAAACLTGCATLPTSDASSPAMSAAYMALGTEPFWNLEITPERMNFNHMDRPRLEFANPGWREANGERTIRTRRITIRIVTDSCSDGMSDNEYPESVTVIVDGQTFNGCGGRAMSEPAASLERSSWRIVAVNGRPALEGIEADLQFADGRVSGSAGCNLLMGSFTQDRNRLTIGAVAATRMACMGAQGEQETRVLAILRQPLIVQFGERMTMIWTAPDGSSIGLRRLDWD